MKIFFKILIFIGILLNFSSAETVDPIKELNKRIINLEKKIGSSLKVLSKKSLNKKDTIKFISEYVLILEDERSDGKVTYFFNDKEYPVRFHKNKILLHILSTDHYRNELIDRGYDVQLVTEKELIGNNYFDSFFKKNNINEVHYCDPVDYTITKRLDRSINSLSIKSYKYL